MAKLALRFGPYAMPGFTIGGKLDCEYAGTVRVVAISNVRPFRRYFEAGNLIFRRFAV